MPLEIAAELAPTGVLRVGVNLSNFLLVTGKAANAFAKNANPLFRPAVVDDVADIEQHGGGVLGHQLNAQQKGRP